MDDFQNICYPNKCKPVNESLQFEELFRRLQQLSTNLQNLSQEEGSDQKYTPLAIHLTDDFFLKNESRDIQLLVACCIADLLRIFAPEAPYKDQKQIKVSSNIHTIPVSVVNDAFHYSFTGNICVFYTTIKWLARSKRSIIQKIFLFIGKFGICKIV